MVLSSLEEILELLEIVKQVVSQARVTEVVTAEAAEVGISTLRGHCAAASAFARVGGGFNVHHRSLLVLAALSTRPVLFEAVGLGTDA